MPGGDMLVTFRIGNGCPDISPEQLVVLVMGKDQVVFDFLKQFVHAATSLSIGSHKARRLQLGEQAVKIRNKGRHLCCHTISLIGSLRSEEHTSELQSRFDLVCRLLLEKQNKQETKSYLH